MNYILHISIDTEFVRYQDEKGGERTDLISLGATKINRVSPLGDFYAISDEYNDAAARKHPLVGSEVLPKIGLCPLYLDAGPVCIKDIARLFSRYLGELHSIKPTARKLGIWVLKGDTDIELIENIFGGYKGLMEAVHRNKFDSYEFFEIHGAEGAKRGLVEKDSRFLHNAFYDACRQAAMVRHVLDHHERTGTAPMPILRSRPPLS